MRESKQEELLSAYLDGELSGDERDFVKRLLETDGAASAAYQDFADLRDRFTSFPRPQLGETWTLSVMDQIRAGQWRKFTDDPRLADGDSFDFTGKTVKNIRAAEKNRPMAGRSVLARLSRVRVWIYPLASVTVVLLFITVLSSRSAWKSSERPTGEQAAVTVGVSEAESASQADKISSDKKSSRPRPLTDEERARRLTPSIPLAQGASDGAPARFETIQIRLAVREDRRQTLFDFHFILQKESAEAGISELNRRVGEKSDIYEISLTRENLLYLLGRLKASNLLEEEPKLSEPLRVWLDESPSPGTSEKRPVQFEVTLAD